jgi:hypothetical protein
VKWWHQVLGLSTKDVSSYPPQLLRGSRRYGQVLERNRFGLVYHVVVFAQQLIWQVVWEMRVFIRVFPGIMVVGNHFAHDFADPLELPPV